MRQIILGLLLLFLTGCASTPQDVELTEEQVVAQRSTREIMQDATVTLDELVSLKGFEYASEESYAALVAYLDLQNAYIAADREDMLQKSERFMKRIEVATKATAKGKQEHLRNLEGVITRGIRDIESPGQPSILDNYPTIYIVKKGDTLPAIAARHEIYNDSFMWPLIYKANRDQIKDPRSIYAGQDLKIARDITVEDIIAARREAGAPEPEKLPKDAYGPKK